MLAIITMGERSFSKVLFTFLLLAGFFATQTVFGSPVTDEDVQSDDAQVNSSAKVLKAYESLELLEGVTHTIQCYISINDDSKLAVVWSFNSTDSTKNEETLFIDDARVDAGADLYNLTKDHGLTILNASLKHVGSYKCFVTPEAYTVHIVSLKVPNVDVSVDIGHISKIVEVGSNLSLSCKVNGQPEPRMEWRRKKSSVSSNTSELIGSSANIIIPNVNVSDSGEYKCWASNSLSEASKSISINVIKEGLSPEHETVFVNHTNKEAILCCMYSRKSKTSLTWAKDNKELPLTGRFDVHAHGKLKFCLTIKRVKEEDLGVYECKTAKVQNYVEKASITLTGAPEKPTFQSSGLVNGTKIPVVRWKVKYGLSPITEFEIHTRKEGDTEWQLYAKDAILGNDVSGEDIEQQFDKLLYGKYQVMLIVRNKQGSAEYRSEDMLVSVDKVETTTEPGRGSDAVRNYASACILVTIFMTLLNR